MNNYGPPAFVSETMRWAGKLTELQIQMVGVLVAKARLQLQPPPPEVIVNMANGLLCQAVLVTAHRNPAWAASWIEKLGDLPPDSDLVASVMGSLPAGEEEEPKEEEEEPDVE